MTAFLSTYVNKVDRKGRVSVPAAYRSALETSGFPGVVAYPSITGPSIEAFGRDLFDRMTQQRSQRDIENGDFEQLLLGGGDVVTDTIMSLATPLPFDGEGRVILPDALTRHADIETAAAFVGRGNRFQIWNPDRFEGEQRQVLERLRARLREEAT